MTKYTVDQIEGNIVVLLQKGNESIRKDVSIDLFPKEIKDGDIVKEVVKKGKIHYSILEKETEERRKKAEELLNKLKNKH